MTEIIEKLSTDPLFVKIAIFIGILLFFSILKKLVKIVFTLIVIFICYIIFSVVIERDPSDDIDFIKEKIETIEIEEAVKATKETTNKIIDEVKENIK